MLSSLDTQYSDFEQETFMAALLNRIFLPIQLSKGYTQKIKWGGSIIQSVCIHVTCLTCRCHNIMPKFSVKIIKWHIEAHDTQLFEVHILCGHIMTPLRVFI